MSSKATKIMIIGQKESFLIRVLLKKLKEENMESFFVPSDINAINAKIEEATVLTYYMESNEYVNPSVLQYLKDKLSESEKKIVLIGEKNDTDTIEKALSRDVVAKVFPRPLDNEKYIEVMQQQIFLEEMNEHKKNILIVDDDPTYLGLVRDWLKGSYKVSMATSGLQAIKWLGQNSADLILLDHEMPVTSGPQVLEMLRSDYETASIPVIFLTGKSDKESVMQVVSLKPEGYFLKSAMNQTELLNQLKEFFDKRNG